MIISSVTLKTERMYVYMIRVNSRTTGPISKIFEVLDGFVLQEFQDYKYHMNIWTSSNIFFIYPLSNKNCFIITF